VNQRSAQWWASFRLPAKTRGSLGPARPERAAKSRRPSCSIELRNGKRAARVRSTHQIAAKVDPPKARQRARSRYQTLG
jgi:hypothetical protein